MVNTTDQPYGNPVSTFLTSNRLTSVQKGNFHRVPFMRGSVKEEGVQFVDQILPKLADFEYSPLIAAIFGIGNVGKVEKQYPVNHSTSDLRETLFPLVTHYTFTCPGRAIVKAMASYGVPVFKYDYEHALSFDAWGANFPYCDHRVCHGSELPILFNSAVLKVCVACFFYLSHCRQGYTPTASEEKLALQLATYWGDFVHGRTSLVGAAGAPEWQKYDLKDRLTARLDVDKIELVQDMYKTKCDMWDEVGYLQD